MSVAVRSSQARRAWMRFARSAPTGFTATRRASTPLPMVVVPSAIGMVPSLATYRHSRPTPAPPVPSKALQRTPSASLSFLRSALCCALTMNVRPTYAQQWYDYRRRRTLFRLALLAIAPVSFGLCIPLMWLFSSDAPLMVVGVLCMLAALVAWGRMDAWLCPRCHRRFFSPRWFLRGRCQYCHLPKWSTTPQSGER